MGSWHSHSDPMPWTGGAGRFSQAPPWHHPPCLGAQAGWTWSSLVPGVPPLLSGSRRCPLPGPWAERVPPALLTPGPRALLPARTGTAAEWALRVAEKGEFQDLQAHRTIGAWQAWGPRVRSWLQPTQPGRGGVRQQVCEGCGRGSSWGGRRLLSTTCRGWVAGRPGLGWEGEAPSQACPSHVAGAEGMPAQAVHPPSAAPASPSVARPGPGATGLCPRARPQPERPAWRGAPGGPQARPDVWPCAQTEGTSGQHRLLPAGCGLSTSLRLAWAPHGAGLSVCCCSLACWPQASPSCAKQRGCCGHQACPLLAPGLRRIAGLLQMAWTPAHAHCSHHLGSSLRGRHRPGHNTEGSRLGPLSGRRHRAGVPKRRRGRGTTHRPRQDLGAWQPLLTWGLRAREEGQAGEPRTALGRRGRRLLFSTSF